MQQNADEKSMFDAFVVASSSTVGLLRPPPSESSASDGARALTTITGKHTLAMSSGFQLVDNHNDVKYVCLSPYETLIRCIVKHFFV